MTNDQTGPDQTELDQTGPDQTGPDQTELDQTELDQTGPDAAGPDAAESDSAEPESSDTGAAGPDDAEQHPAEPDNVTPADPDDADPDDADLDAAEPDATAPTDRGDERSLFLGDTGVFDVDTRRALVRLIRGPFLDASADDKVWAALMRNDRPVRQFLAEIFLTLVVDSDDKIAFTQQAAESEVTFPKLQRRVSLNLVDSALLLFLRQELSAVSGSGQRAIVGLEDMTAQLVPYEREGVSDHSMQLKRINAAVKKMRDNGILRATATEARYEISPVLRILFPPEQIVALTEAYARLKSDASAADEAEGPDGGDADE